MGSIVLVFLFSAFVVIVAGIFLTISAETIAVRTKLGKLVVGGVLLAGATSLPELFVDLSAVRAGMPDLAVGDLLGSSIFNLLILATADLLHRGRTSFFTPTAAKHALSACLSIVLTGIVVLGIIIREKMTWEFLGISLPLWVMLFAYGGGIRLVYVDQKFRFKRFKEMVEEEPPRFSLKVAIGIFLLCAMTLGFVAPVLARAAGEIAEITGLGKTFVGSTLLALSTSLPELVSTLTAVRRGSFDLAIGNIFGSNTFNMLLLIPLDFIFTGGILQSVSPEHAFTGIAVILATAVTTMGQLYQVEPRRPFIEPDALLVMSICLLSFYLLGM